MRRKFHRFALHIGRGTVHVGRWTWYASAVILVILALVFTVVRVGLPALAEKKAEIEKFISEKSNYPVRIGKLDAYWRGLRPGLRIEDLEIFSSADLLRAVRFGEVRVSLGLLPLLWGEVQIDSLVVARPSLALERLLDGSLRVTGFAPVQIAGKAGDGKLLRWLLQQKELIIEDGELQWFDHLGERRGLYLSRINLNLQNDADRHQFGISAQLPRKVCGDCSLIFDITGNPLLDEAWSGHIFLKAIGLKLNGIPAVVRRTLPAQLAGEFDVQLWTKWQNGKLRSVKGDVSVTDFKLPLRRLNQLIAVKEARTDLELKTSGDHWDLNLENLRLGLRGPAWTAGHLRIAHGPSTNTVRIEHVNLDDLTAFLVEIHGSNKLLGNLQALQPRGKVHALELRIVGDGAKLDDYTLEAQLEDIETKPLRKIPGVTGVSGHLFAQGRHGAFVLDAHDVILSAPHVFRVPVNASSVFGRLQWVMREQYWQVTGEDLRVVGDDGRGTGTLTLRVPYDRRTKPYLNLRAEFGDGNGAHARRYTPINLLTAKTVAWLDQSIVAGQVTSGELVYDGNLADFPFRDGSGDFEVRLHVEDGVFNYLPGWTPITGIDADIHFKRNRMLITGNQAKIGDLNVDNVIARADDLRKRGDSIVEVSGTAVGSVTETLRVLRQSPVALRRREWKSYLDVAVGATGQGAINLQLTIPVRKAADFTMTGEYVVQDGTLDLKLARLKAKGVHGRVGFDQSGPTTGRLRGQFLGGEADLNITGQAGDQRDKTLVSGQGVLTSAGIGEAFAWPVADYLQGTGTWHGTLRLSRGIPRLHMEADLTAMTSGLPVPLSRPAGISEKLILTSQDVGRERHVLSLQVGDVISGKLAFARQPSGWLLARGKVAVGETSVRLPETNGLQVSARAEQVDADGWLRVLAWGSVDAKRPPDYLNRFSGEFSSVYLVNREFGPLKIELARNPENWLGWLKGDAADGQIKISPATKASTAKIELDLEHLVVLAKRPTPERVLTDPRTLPTLGLKVKLFQYEDKNLGAVDFWAVHTTLGWKVVHFNIVRPEMKLFLNGDWSLVVGEHSTELELQFSTSDMGETLRAFGLPDQMEGGKVELTAELSWQGAPIDASLATLNGTVVVAAEDGRFLRIKQGAGRLFGALDFSSIGKFLTLDFDPVLGKGLHFKKLSGDIAIENGDAYTHNLYMTGPAAEISFNGRIGFAAEDFDLAMQVIPRLGTNIAIWQLLGPQVAITLLAIEKLLKKQIAKGTRITYEVKGPWQQPTITRLGSPAPDFEEAPGDRR
ncbi:MAG: YhdP family protein [Acidiferrobacterales bacterium]